MKTKKILKLPKGGVVSEFPQVGSVTVIFVFPRALGSWDREFSK